MLDRGEIPTAIRVWRSGDLQWYTRAMEGNSETSDSTYSIEKFPDEIIPPDGLQVTFNEMRAETVADGQERWNFIGRKFESPFFDDVPLLVPTKYLKAREGESGFSGEADYERIVKMIEDAQYSIENVLAVIHSHYKFDPRVWNPIHWWRNRGKSMEDNFSTVDLHTCLAGNKKRIAINYLVGPTKNLVMFRTQQTKMIPGVGLDAFSDKWMRQYSWNNPTADFRKLNLDVAAAHNLVLYEGKPNQNLKIITR